MRNQDQSEEQAWKVTLAYLLIMGIDPSCVIVLILPKVGSYIILCCSILLFQTYRPGNSSGPRNPISHSICRSA